MSIQHACIKGEQETTFANGGSDKLFLQRAACNMHQTEKHCVVPSILTPCSAPIKLIHSNRSILAYKANGALHCCLPVAPGHSYSWPLIQVFIIFTSHRRGSSNSMSSFMRKQHVYRDNLPSCPLSLVSHLHILTEIYFQHLTVLHHL